MKDIKIMEVKMKKFSLVVLLVLVFVSLPAMAEEQKTQSAGNSPSEVVTKTYILRSVMPEFIKESLRVYFITCSYGDDSNMISVVLDKKNVATFEEQLRKLDVEKKTIQLRIFTVLAAKEGKNDTIENKDLKRVLAEVSNLLNFKSYVLDGASVIMLKDNTRRSYLSLSSSMYDPLQLYINHVAVLTGGNGKRSVKLGLELYEKKDRLLDSETEIAENGYLVAGVSRIGNDGKSLVLVINAEIK
jgi:hypothetical protein